MSGWVWRFYLGAGALATGGYYLLSDGAGAVLFVLVMVRLAGLVRGIERWEAERRHLLDQTMHAAEQERTRIAVELHDGPIQRLSVLSYDLERARQRVLGNPAAVARLEHAQAERLWLELEGQGDRVHFCIRDDGVGFDPMRGSELVRNGHFGLVPMRERVEMAGGRFQLESRPGAGVVVKVSFDLPSAA